MNGSPHEPPGWWGKLSSLGDFASRRVTPEWVRACDDWLARSIAISQQVLGARWLEVYLGAPVWRFAWAPGVIDRDWWFGVLMPSCDNVGRYYPLVVVQRRERPPIDRIGFDHLELWWMHVARAAMQTLGEPSTLESFEAALAQAPPWPSNGPVMVPQQRGVVAGRERFAIAPGCSLGQLLHGLSVSELHGRNAGHSFWWPIGDGAREGSFSLGKGLPDASSFAELLAGSW
ncbi:type VI secretion system-associated protein TagF [Aquincola sp. S2]|uniref:Type VI secretion system-associated protein TagF n=1 Tax=Pseudaquabacterium terrae TaxID=2732868 RepID=A0ABX2ED11_9BURK|nr:type VI secretion system-associated protein TagF [Aquabacterium terrae]NRF66434.1 type VI secretion system-associated protein TagF [Aquabacterium terrae]